MHRFWRGLRGIIVIQDTPHRIAWGVAIGTFVAYLPIVGIQMLIGAFVCWLFRANVIASLPMAWITNPVTIVPIYYGLFVLGGVFTGDEMSYEQMKVLISQINDAFRVIYRLVVAVWKVLGQLIIFSERFKLAVEGFDQRGLKNLE